jgi:mRNA-degrading endonuclease RelE of RelBE toxin-antitoxin system
MHTQKNESQEYQLFGREFWRKIGVCVYTFLYVEELQNSFAPIRLDVKKLKGYEDTYRIRLGSWRIIYKVDAKEKLTQIYDILPRKKAY